MSIGKRKCFLQKLIKDQYRDEVRQNKNSTKHLCSVQNLCHLLKQLHYEKWIHKQGRQFCKNVLVSLVNPKVYLNRNCFLLKQTQLPNGLRVQESKEKSQNLYLLEKKMEDNPLCVFILPKCIKCL